MAADVQDAVVGTLFAAVTTRAAVVAGVVQESVPVARCAQVRQLLVDADVWRVRLQHRAELPLAQPHLGIRVGAGEHRVEELELRRIGQGRGDPLRQPLGAELLNRLPARHGQDPVHRVDLLLMVLVHVGVHRVDRGVQILARLLRPLDELDAVADRAVVQAHGAELIVERAFL